VVVLGAGGLGAGVVAALTDPRQRDRPGEVILINRTEATALEVVEGLNGDIPVRPAGLNDLRAALVGARLLVTAVEAEDAVVTAADLLAAAGTEILVIDLGMPRNVAPEVGDLDQVDLVDISHLSDLVDRAMQERRGEVAAAGDIVAEEVSRYLEEQRGRGAAPVVVALRERLESIRASELERRASDLADLTPAQRDAVDSLTRSMLAKLVHEPTVMLKESAGTPRGERLVESVRALFGL
jgi:glutamyl-tRNA reductase